MRDSSTDDVCLNGVLQLIGNQHCISPNLATTGRMLTYYVFLVHFICFKSMLVWSTTSMTMSHLVYYIYVICQPDRHMYIISMSC